MACHCSPSPRAPYIGFDDIHFRILVDGQGVLPDWQLTPVVAERHIPGSNRSVRQNLGMEPARVTWRLWFCCRDAFYAMLGKLNQAGTLRILHGQQSLAGTVETHLGVPYDILDTTIVTGIAQAQTFRDGTVEADVSFQRAVEPGTRQEGG